MSKSCLVAMSKVDLRKSIVPMLILRNGNVAMLILRNGNVATSSLALESPGMGSLCKREIEMYSSIRSWTLECHLSNYYSPVNRFQLWVVIIQSGGLWCNTPSMYGTIGHLIMHIVQISSYVTNMIVILWLKSSDQLERIYFIYGYQGRIQDFSKEGAPLFHKPS